MITRKDSSTFVMDNGFISRTMTVDKRGLHTSSLINKQNNFEYVYAIGGEFGFSADDKYLGSFSALIIFCQVAILLTKLSISLLFEDNTLSHFHSIPNL